MSAVVDREEGGPPEDVEKEARSMGWVPEEEFKGNKDHWIDAEEFVERGRSVMPILLSNNKRLQKELSTRDAEIGKLSASLQSANKAIEKLEKHYTEANKRAVEIARNQLKEELRQAREDNDVDKELEITDQLAELRTRETEATPTAKKEEETKPVQKYTPDFQSWVDRNPWFEKDRKKTKLVNRIAEDLREEGNELVGSEFLDECVRIYEEQYGEEEEEEAPPVRRPSSKVETTPRRRSPSGGGKSYGDLPAEAKAQCAEDAEDLVGPDKRYKTMKDWQTAYARIYFAE